MPSLSTRGVQRKVVGLLLVIVSLAFWALSVAQSAPAAQSSPAAQDLTPAAFLPLIMRAIDSPTMASTR